MPWEKSFDKREALDAVMHVFWQKGFERTSITDLSKSAGASRYGLYDEFGDKRAIYHAALDHYRDQLVTNLLGTLESDPNAGLSDLHEYFERLLDACGSESGKLGCFMSLSAVDQASQDSGVRSRVLVNFERVRAAFERALINAAESGEWTSGHDPRSVAETLLGVIQGAAVFQRAGEQTASIKQYIRRSVSLLL